MSEIAMSEIAMGEIAGLYFLSSPQLRPQLHRMYTGTPALALAQNASASAEFREGKEPRS
jgi:hypothetical protein